MEQPQVCLMLVESSVFMLYCRCSGTVYHIGYFHESLGFLTHERCSMDFATTEYVHDRRNMYRTTHAALLSVGIIFCVLCAVPAVLMDALHLPSFMDDISGAVVLAIVAIGVFMIVLTSMKMGSF